MSKGKQPKSKPQYAELAKFLGIPLHQGLKLAEMHPEQVRVLAAPVGMFGQETLSQAAEILEISEKPLGRQR